MMKHNQSVSEAIAEALLEIAQENLNVGGFWPIDFHEWRSTGAFSFAVTAGRA